MAWNATVLNCTTISEQSFTLTFYAEGQIWTADDPHGVLEVTNGAYRGTYSASDLLATSCFFEDRELVQVVADVTSLATGVEGTGSIVGGEDFGWVCGAVLE